VRSLKEQRKLISGDVTDPNLKLKRYKLKIQHDLLNSLLNNYGLEKLMDTLLHEEYVRELAEVIEKDD